MANYTWSVTFQDANVPPGRATVQGFFTGADEAAAEAYVQGIVEAMNNPAPAGVGALPLTLGLVIDVNIQRSIDFSAWSLRTVAAAGAENQKGGRFIFKGVAENSRTQMTIPTFNEALKAADGSINIANPAVFAFYDTGVLGAGGADNRYADLATLSDAYITYSGKSARR